MLCKLHVTLEERVLNQDKVETTKLHLVSGFLPEGHEAEACAGLIAVIERYLREIDAGGEFVEE